MGHSIKVLLLAGGKSTRFWPLSNKLTLPFLGRTLLEYQISLLHEIGFRDIVVVTTPELKERFAGTSIKIVIQQGAGQGSAILSAKSAIQGSSVLIVNADDLIAKSLFESLLNLIDAKSNILVGYKTKQYFPGGYLVLNGKKVAKIHEKPGEGNEPSSFVKLVCDYFVNVDTLVGFLEKTPIGNEYRHYEDALSEMIGAGHQFEMLEYEDVWIPLKYPWHTLLAMNHFLKTIRKSNKSKGVKVHKSAVIVGPVVLEEGVKVLEFAKIVGPSHIGAGVIIGNHTLIRTSMIGENSIIGFGSEITRSYIGSNSWFHTNYIGDSVVSDNVGVGAGAVIANLRLDEGNVYSMVHQVRVNSHLSKLGAILGEGSRIGIETSLMPGVKVGKNSIVGPGVVLREDLPDGKYCYTKQVLQIEDSVNPTVKNRERFRAKL